MRNHDWSDQDLYNAFCNDDQSRLTEAFQVLQRELLPWAVSMLRNSALPEPDQVAHDCVQEALVKAWQKSDTVQNPHSFRSFVKTTLRNLTLTLLQREKRAQREKLADDDLESLTDGINSPSITVEKAEQYSLLFDRMKLLSTRSQTVVLGKYLYGYSDIELSEICSEAEGKDVLYSHIQVTRSRNLEKLRKDKTLRL